MKKNIDFYQDIDLHGNTLKNVVLQVLPTRYEHDQSMPSNIWTIVHNLNCHPSVTVVNSAGDTIITGTTYIDLNTIQLTFSGSFSGKAYIN